MSTDNIQFTPPSDAIKTTEFTPPSDAKEVKKKDDGEVLESQSEAPSTSDNEIFIREQLDLQEQAFSTATNKTQEPEIQLPQPKPMSRETFEDIAAESKAAQQEVVQAEEDKKLFEEFDKARTKLKKSAAQDEAKEKRKEADKGIIKEAPEELKAKFESGELQQADFHPDGNYFYGYLKNVNRSTSSFFRKINGAEKLISKGLNKASFGKIPETEGVMGNVADWVDDKVVKGLAETPDNVLGGVIGQLGAMTQFPTELMLTPSAKIKALSTVTGGAINGIPKLATLLGVGGGLETYAETGDIKKSAVRGAQGFSDGLFLNMLGGLSGTAAQGAFKNPLSQTLTASGINATGFGGKSAFEQYTTTGEVKGKEVGEAIGLALALSAPDIAKMGEVYFSSTRNTDRSVSKMKVNFKELNKEYEKLIIEENDTKTSPERKAEIKIAKQGMQNFVSEKIAIDDVKKDPQKYRDIVETDETLNKKEKKFQLDKIDQIEKLDIKPLEQEIAELALEAEKQPKYIIEGKEFETKEEFLKEVQKVEVKDKAPKIEVKNDDITTKEVADILEGKLKAAEKPLESPEPIKTEKVIETIPKKKEAVQEAKIEVADKEAPKVEVEPIDKKIEAEKTQPTEYKTKEEFKKDFLSEEVIDVNLIDTDVDGMKMVDKVAAAKNLRDGKTTVQGEILEKYLDESFENKKLRLVDLDKKGKTPADISSIEKPKEATTQEVYREYAKVRATEDGRKLTPKQAEKTVNARDEMINEFKLTVKDDIVSPKKAEKKGFKEAKAESKVRLELINDLLKKSKDQKHITAFEHKVIRNRLKDVAGGTAFQMKKAVEYAEKIIQDSEFRAQEKDKVASIKKVEKEIKSLRNKTSKFKTVKRAFNVPEVREIIKEYEGLVKEGGLNDLTNETVKSILDDIQMAKKIAVERDNKVEKFQEQKKDWEKKSLAQVEPVKGFSESVKKYVEGGATVTAPKEAEKQRRFRAYDENLTSIFSKLASKSKETGDIGKDWLNKEFYHKRLLTAERGFKKFSQDETKKVSEFVKKTFGKDVEVVLNEMNREKVEITVDVIDKDGNITQNKKQITKGEAIKKWMELQDVSLHPRIFEPMRIQSDGKVVRGNGFTDLTVKEIESSMTPKDLELANKLFEGYRDLGKRYREYFAEQFGIIFPEKEFYSNIYSEFTDSKGNTGQVVEDMYANAPSGTVRANNSMSRIANKNRIKEADALSSYFDYVDKMEWMFQFGEASEMYSSIINNSKFQRAVQATHGKATYKALKDYEDVINRNIENRDDVSIRAISKMFSGAALGMNPNIALKQSFSILTSMTEVNPLEFAKRVPQFAAETTAALTGKDNDVAKLAKRASITGRGRTGLGHDIFLDPKVRRDKVSHIPVLHAAKKFFSKGIEYQTKGIEWVDKGASLMGGYIVYKAKKADYIKRGMSVTDAESQAALDFDIFVDATQQSQSMFNTSITRMNAGQVGKMAGMFTTAVSQFQRFEQNAWANVATGITNKGQFKNKKVVKNLASIAIMRQLIPMLYQYAADGWQWDDKNQRNTALIGNLSGLFIAGKLAEKLKNTLAGDNYDAAITPVIDNIQRAMSLSSDFLEMTQYPELYTEKQKDKVKDAYTNTLGYLTGVGVRGIKILVKGEFADFFDGSRTDQNKLATEAIKTNEDILDVLEKEYGEEFVYTETGSLSAGSKAYVREYMFQEEKSDYGNYADEMYEVMNMYDFKDKVKYLDKQKNKMNKSDFDEMMDELVFKRTFGSTVDRKTGKRKQRTVGSYISKSVYDKVYEINED